MFARKLKAAAKDPQSFELKMAIVAADGSVCYRFRARNSFNAALETSAVLVVGQGMKLLVQGENDAFAAAWNKHCTPAGGEDMTALINQVGLDE